MRRMIAVALALVLSATIAACTGMSGQGTDDRSTNDKSMHSGGSSY
jgi:predicted small secreted protein